MKMVDGTRALQLVKDRENRRYLSARSRCTMKVLKRKSTAPDRPLTMNLWSQALVIARIEVSFFLRFRKLLLATVVVGLIPAIYTVIYLSSVWDPQSNTGAMAVALVNLDQDVQYQGQTFNVGKEVITRLKAKQTFGFVDAQSEDAVRRAVRSGELAFALVIPPNFSYSAVPGAQQGAGKLVVYTSEGNNYQSAFMARRFAEDLGHAVNESLNERRWALVLSTAAGSQRSVVQLRDAAQKLRTGSHALAAGAAQATEVAQAVTQGAKSLDSGVDQLVDGFIKLATGLRSLDAGRPQEAELTALPHSATQVIHGLHSYTEELPDDARVQSLSDGSKQLVGGTAMLEDANRKVSAGAQKLAAGIETLAVSLPASLQDIQGTAQGMAHSVQPEVAVDAVVQNQGASFAPNVVPAALWLGAGIIAFLVHVKVMPTQAETFSPVAQFTGKIMVPAVIVLLQALVVLLVMVWVLHIEVKHMAALCATLAAASLTFLCIVFAMTRALGDAGKALAMLFLAVQLSSSGGVLPVELSGGLFAQISPWLPMTWVVKAIKASLFGAYEDAWQWPLLQIVAAGCVTAVFAAVWGRWRFVNPDHMRPAVDF